MDQHLGAARHPRRLLFRRRRQLEAAAALGAPHPGLVRAGAAAGDLDPVGDHEHRIEADAEAADQPRPVVGLGQPLEERLGARARDGAEIVDQLLLRHADARIGDRQGAGLGIGRETDGEPLVAGDQVRPGDRLVAQLVARIGGVGDQLAQEDVGFGIDRVNHQVQQLGDFGLEGVGFGCGLFCHGGRQSGGSATRHQARRRFACRWENAHLNPATRLSAALLSRILP